MKRGTVAITVENVRKVPLYILNSKRVQEAIVATARTFAAQHDTIPGLKIDRGTDSSIR